MSSNDNAESREAFESVFSHKNLDGFSVTHVKLSTGERTPGWHYHNRTTQALWEGWKAREYTRPQPRFTEAELVEKMWCAALSDVREQNISKLDMQDALRALIASGAVTVREG